MNLVYLRTDKKYPMSKNGYNGNETLFYNILLKALK